MAYENSAIEAKRAKHRLWCLHCLVDVVWTAAPVREHSKVALQLISGHPLLDLIGYSYGEVGIPEVVWREVVSHKVVTTLKDMANDVLVYRAWVVADATVVKGCLTR
jgi:hypothetical protein